MHVIADQNHFRLRVRNDAVLRLTILNDSEKSGLM